MQNSGRIDEKIDFSVTLSNLLRRRFDLVVLGDVDFEDVDVRQRRQLWRDVRIPTSRDHFVIWSAGQNLRKLEIKKISF